MINVLLFSLIFLWKKLTDWGQTTGTDAIQQQKMYSFIYFHNFFPPPILSRACYLNFSIYLLQNLPFSTGTFWMQCPLTSVIYSLFSSSVLSWISPSLLSLCIFCTAFFLFSMINFLSCTVFPCCYLRLFPPLLEAGFGVLVETIWQWTVPSSNMSQMAPNTSVVGIPWDWGMETYRTAAATAGERENWAIITTVKVWIMKQWGQSCKCWKEINGQTINSVLSREKCQIFAGSHFINVRICNFSLSLMTVKESLDCKLKTSLWAPKNCAEHFSQLFTF